VRTLLGRAINQSSRPMQQKGCACTYMVDGMELAAVLKHQNLVCQVLCQVVCSNLDLGTL
jgi:hypothetical protein